MLSIYDPYFEFKGQRNDVWLRGVGATLTNTPYVTYFDDDTWPERNHLELVMNYMNKNRLIIHMLLEECGKIIKNH